MLKASLAHRSPYVSVSNTNPSAYRVLSADIIGYTDWVPTQPIEKIKRAILDQILKDRSVKLDDIRYELLPKKSL